MVAFYLKVEGRMQEIYQAWWHLEDCVSPSDGKIYRQVLDIYTDEKVILVKLDKNFVRLKIKSKYHGQELPFVAGEDGFVRVNVGKPSIWPTVTPLIQHVKFEVEYIDTDPQFERFPKFLRLFGYENTYSIEGFTQPEFSITLPKGLKLRHEGLKFWEPYWINMMFIKTDKKTHEKQRDIFEFYPAYISQENGNKTYNFLIESESYKKLSDTDPEDYEVSFEINYATTNEWKYFTVTAFSFILPAIILIDVGNDIFNIGDPFVSLTYIVILISFSTFYLTLHKEGYEIPWNTWVMWSIPISGMLFLASEYARINSITWTTIISYVAQILAPYL